MKTQKAKHILATPNNMTWTNAIHQDEIEDNLLTTFRFVTYNARNKPTIFKMNINNLKKIKIK